jgi:hypothetical protein
VIFWFRMQRGAWKAETKSGLLRASRSVATSSRS